MEAEEKELLRELVIAKKKRLTPAAVAPAPANAPAPSPVSSPAPGAAPAPTQVPFVDFLDALFRALIENELEVLRFGYPTQTWSERIRQMPVPDIHREGGGERGER
jgi:hypothetical protein